MRIAPRDLFVIFFKAGLAFGGGLGILAVLEDEIVTRRKAMTKDEFLAIYGIGRIVPSGTMTALAVAFGYRFGRLFGTLIALIAMVLPAFILTVLLTASYDYVRDTDVFDAIQATVIPAALAFIVAAAIRLGRGIYKPSIELLLAIAAFIGAFVFDLNAALLLVGGGVLGAILQTVKDRREARA